MIARLMMKWKGFCLKPCDSCCVMVSLKPGHIDWVRDFDFMLNLFSFPSP